MEIDGMFAISLWDIKRKKLILVRYIWRKTSLFGFDKNIFFLRN